MILKRFISLIMMTLIVVSAYASTRYKVTSLAPLNVRGATSMEADILGTIVNGTQIDVISVKKGWAKIKFNGKDGYVLTQYIEKISQTSDTKSNSTTGTNSSEIFGIKTSAHENNPDDLDFESQRKIGVYELTYSAGSFEDVKLSGTYGFSWTMLPWKIAPKLYVGIHFSPLNFNYGLSDFNYDEIRLGPAIGYYFTPQLFISIPLDVLCDVYFGDNNDTKTAWGMALAPAIYWGKKAGIFIGPQFQVGFSSGSKVSCGFRAGVYF